MRIEQLNVRIYTSDIIDSRMYVLIGEKEAIIIDPFQSAEALRFLRDNGIQKVTMLLTHEHFDHISGVNWFRSKIDSKVIASQKCANNIISPERNFSRFGEIILMDKKLALKIEPFSCFADMVFCEKLEIQWNGYAIQLIETPGHSEGSICIIVDRKFMFSGDTLVNGHRIITRIPGGSRKDYDSITLPFLKQLNRDMVIYPGHGDAALLFEFDY